MDNFSIISIDDISIIKVDVAAATMRDAPALWEVMEKNSLFEQKKIIIDLSLCTFVDSTFIGMIVKVFKKVAENQGQIKLIFPQITDIESFRIIGISKILECFETVESAVENFKTGSTNKKITIDEKSLYYSISDRPK